MRVLSWRYHKKAVTLRVLNQQKATIVNRNSILRRLACLCLAALTGAGASAQIRAIDRRHVTDTLTFAQRLTFRTNTVDWALLVPNAGVEFDLGATNHARWTVGANFRVRPLMGETYTQKIVWKYMEARADVRQYWRPRQVKYVLYEGAQRDDAGHYVSCKDDPVGYHTRWIDRLFSLRRRNVRHPATTYFRGFYAAYTEYALRLSHVGRQGKMFSAGVQYGIVRPLYVYQNGMSIDLELSAAVGAAYGRVDKFTQSPSEDVAKDHYALYGARGTWGFYHYPVVNELRLGLVFRPFKYPVTKKYRFRYDTDLAYRAQCMDRLLHAREQNDSVRSAEEQRQEMERLYKRVYQQHAQKNKPTTKRKK